MSQRASCLPEAQGAERRTAQFSALRFAFSLSLPNSSRGLGGQQWRVAGSHTSVPLCPALTLSATFQWPPSLQGSACRSMKGKELALSEGAVCVALPCPFSGLVGMFVFTDEETEVT